MFFGSIGGSGGGAGNAGTYSAATLGVGINNTYRLGAGIGVLRLTANNVLTDSTVNSITTPNSLIVGEPLSSVASTIGTGTVVLNANANAATNSFSGGTTVNLGSTLEASANTGTPTGSPLGTGATKLNGSRLQGDGNATTSLTLNVPEVDFTSDANLTGSVTSPTTGVLTLNVGTLSRQSQGVLQVSAIGTANTLGTNTKIFVTNNAPATTAINGAANTMVAPYYVDASGNFLTYAAGTGFSLATAGVATVGASANTNDYVKDHPCRHVRYHEDHLCVGHHR